MNDCPRVLVALLLSSAGCFDASAGYYAPPPPVGMSCGAQTFSLHKAPPPNIMLMLDRSASMAYPISNLSRTSKYSDLESAIDGLVSRYDASMHFGSTFFAADDLCAPGIVGPIAANNGTTVITDIARHMPGGDTPTAATLDAIIASNELGDPARANYLVLATDGLPNCDDIEVTRRIEQLYNASPPVRTFVIGIGSEIDTDPVLLTEWADVGHTARTGPVHYYQTDSPAELDASFDHIAGEIVGCDFQLAAAPPDPARMNIVENGSAVARSSTIGWTYDDKTNTITLHGAACDTVRANAQVQLSVVYGCPSLA